MRIDNKSIVDRVFDALQMVSEDNCAYYNKVSGEILWLNEFFDNYRELCEEIENDENNYIPLPTYFDIHEYSIMRNFASQYNNSKISDELLRCLQGKGAFRRFKDKLYYCGIEKEWFIYRDMIYKNIAEEWCSKNHLG